MLPLFFVPNERAITSELLVTHGLDRLVPRPQSRYSAGGGPQGATGLLIADESVPMDRLAVDESQQAWSARFGMTSLVGTWLDAPPTAEELQRDRGIAGSAVSLLDGHSWQVPILRKWSPDSIVDWTCQLPRVMEQCAQSGAWLITAVVPEYRALWDHSMRIAQALFDQLSDRDAAELDWSDLFDFAVAVLKVNYHVDASVLSHLQILQPDLAAEIVQAALDWPTLRASLKNALSRHASGGTNTESGATPPTEV